MKMEHDSNSRPYDEIEEYQRKNNSDSREREEAQFRREFVDERYSPLRTGEFRFRHRNE